MYAFLIRRFGGVVQAQTCVQRSALAASARRALATDATFPNAGSLTESSSSLDVSHISQDPLQLLEHSLRHQKWSSFWELYNATDWRQRSGQAFRMAASACMYEARQIKSDASNISGRVDKLHAAMQRQGVSIPGGTRLAMLDALCLVHRQDIAVQHLQYLWGPLFVNGAKMVWRTAFSAGDVSTGEACQRLVGLMLPDQPPWVRAERIKQCGASGDAQGVQREWEAALAAAPTDPSDVLGLYSSRVMALARLSDCQGALQAMRELAERVKACLPPELLRLSAYGKHNSLLNLVYMAYDELVTQGGRGLLGVAEWRQLITLLSQHGIPLHPRVFVTVMSRVEPGVEGRLRARAVMDVMQASRALPTAKLVSALAKAAAGDAEFERELSHWEGTPTFKPQQPKHPIAAHGEHGGAPAGSQADAQADPAWVAHVAHTLQLERQLSAPDGLSSEGSVSKEEFVEQLVLALQACTAIPRPTPAKPLPPGTAAALQQLLQAAARQVHLLGAAAIVNAGRMWSHLLLPLDPAVRSALAARFMELLQRGEVPTRPLMHFLAGVGGGAWSPPPHEGLAIARELARRSQTEGDAFNLQDLSRCLMALGRFAQSGPELAEAVQTLAQDGTLNQLSAAAEAQLSTASHQELSGLMYSWSLMGWYPPMPLVSQVLERFAEAKGAGPSRQASPDTLFRLLHGLGGLPRVVGGVSHPLLHRSLEALAQSLLERKALPVEGYLLSKALRTLLRLEFCPADPTLVALLHRLRELPARSFRGPRKGLDQVAELCVACVADMAGQRPEARELAATLAPQVEVDVVQLLERGLVARAARAVQCLAFMQVTSTAARLYPRVCSALDPHASDALRSRDHADETDAAWRLQAARILLQQQGAEGLPPDPSWLQALQDDWWQHQRKEDNVRLRSLLAQLGVEAEVHHRTKDGWQIPLVLPTLKAALVLEARPRFFANTRQRTGYAYLHLQVVAAQWANDGTVVALPLLGAPLGSGQEQSEEEQLDWLQSQLRMAGLHLPDALSMPSGHT